MAASRLYLDSNNFEKNGSPGAMARPGLRSKGRIAYSVLL